MSLDATLDNEGAPRMDAPVTDQDPALLAQEGAAGDGATADESGQDDRPKSPREQAMDAIAAKRLLDLESETGVRVGPDEAGDHNEAPRKLRVKVDGEELELLESDVIKGFQKDATASRRLEQAAAESKRLQDEWDRLNAERAAFEQTRKPAAVDEGSQATPLEGDAGVDVKAIYEALVSGDEDEAVKALKTITQGRPTEAIPPEKIAARVRQQIAWEDAQSAFAKDYSDIQTDPLLRQIASNTLAETLKTSTTYEQAFREAGDRTRAWLRGVGGSAQAGGGNALPDPDLAEKQLRKERIDNPTAVNARAGGKPKEQAETPQDVIAEMRRARGLPA